MSSFASVKHKLIHLSGTITDEHYSLVSQFLLSVKAPATITVEVNSDGGDETAAFAIYDRLREFVGEGGRVTTKGIGQVQSSAVLPFLAGDIRQASKNCCFMIHHGTFGLAENINQKEIIGIGRELMRLDRSYMRIIASRTGLSYKKTKRLVRHGSYFDTAKAKCWGFIT